MQDIKVIQLYSKDWEKYKIVRLHAIKENPIALGINYLEENKYSQTKLRKLLSKNLYISVQQDNSIVGYIGIKLYSKSNIRHRAELTELYIKKEYRGNGLAKELLKITLNNLKEYGIKKIVVYVIVTDNNIYKFYLKQGFKIVGRLNEDIAINDKLYDANIMEKKL